MSGTFKLLRGWYSDLSKKGNCYNHALSTEAPSVHLLCKALPLAKPITVPNESSEKRPPALNRLPAFYFWVYEYVTNVYDPNASRDLSQMRFSYAVTVVASQRVLPRHRWLSLIVHSGTNAPDQQEWEFELVFQWHLGSFVQQHCRTKWHLHLHPRERFVQSGEHRFQALRAYHS